VPEALLAAAPARRRRARLSVWFVVGLTPLVLAGAAVSTAVRGPNLLAAELFAGCAVLLLALPILRWTRSLALAGTAILLGLVAPMVAVAWSGYGLLSPANLLLVLAPVAGFALGGRRAGIAVAVVAAAQMVALLAATLLGWQAPRATDEPVHAVLFAQTGVVSIVLVALFLYQYDVAWRRALARSVALREEFEASRDVAVRADAKKGRFLLSVASQLRAPIHTAIGYCEGMMAESDSVDLRRIYRASRDLLGRVNDMADLAQIDGGQLELQLGLVSLRGVVEEVLDDARPMITGGVTLIDDAMELPVFGDRDRLRQVLTTVVCHALSTTPQGSVTLRSRPVGDAIHIQVVDTGDGMTDAQVSRCFDAYDGDGMDPAHPGLRLALSQRLCRLMGGNIAVQSLPGQGSTFTVSLQRAARISSQAGGMVVH